MILIGATGVGKSFIACALAHQACRKGYRALYRRASRLFHELTLARADGTYIRLLAKLARVDVLVIDDWGLAPRPGSGAPRPPRDPRGSLRHPLDHHHQPAPARQVARLPRRPHPGRRHLRPPPPQRPPDRAKRTLTAKGGQARHLTDRPSVASLRSRCADPAYHDATDLGDHDGRNAHYRHLVGHGKRPPVAVAAIARELVGFIWAAMTQRAPGGLDPDAVAIRVT